MLPAWLQVWWREFEPEAELYLDAVRKEDEIIGIAPLQISGAKASFIGSVDVCDYLDFVVVPEREVDFFDILLDDLSQQGVDHLDLRALRPDSSVLTHLIDIARQRGAEVACQKEAVSLEIDLPPTWDDYLTTLNKKQRHEIRRRIRRLGEAGDLDYRCTGSNQETGELLDTFLRLFPLSREDKASFMNSRMESFFKSVAQAMADIGILRFGILELDSVPTAMTMGFDYNNSIYLYNSAFDPRYNHLSVGVLSKVFCIKESIEEGKQRFDLLKGDETYKYHLGGKEIPLYRCQITIK
jgi:CelD/BcsL family acetyltransferase involved in cellulose biosynthesis